MKRTMKRKFSNFIEGVSMSPWYETAYQISLLILMSVAVILMGYALIMEITGAYANTTINDNRKCESDMRIEGSVVDSITVSSRSGDDQHISFILEYDIVSADQ